MAELELYESNTGKNSLEKLLSLPSKHYLVYKDALKTVVDIASETHYKITEKDLETVDDIKHYFAKQMEVYSFDTRSVINSGPFGVMVGLGIASYIGGQSLVETVSFLGGAAYILNDIIYCRYKMKRVKAFYEEVSDLQGIILDKRDEAENKI